MIQELWLDTIFLNLEQININCCTELKKNNIYEIFFNKFLNHLENMGKADCSEF